MSDPVELLCDVISKVDGEIREEVIWFACMAVGHKPRTTGVAPGPKVPIGQLFERPTLSDLRDRLRALIDDVDLLPELLIPGVLQYLSHFYETLGAPENASRVIDSNLDMLKKLNEEMKRPVSARFKQIDDESLRNMISTIERVLGNLSERRAAAQSVAEILNDAWSTQFPALRR
jgi:hypothetical protein